MNPPQSRASHGRGLCLPCKLPSFSSDQESFNSFSHCLIDVFSVPFFPFPMRPSRAYGSDDFSATEPWRASRRASLEKTTGNLNTLVMCEWYISRLSKEVLVSLQVMGNLGSMTLCLLSWRSGKQQPTSKALRTCCLADSREAWVVTQFGHMSVTARDATVRHPCSPGVCGFNAVSLKFL